MTFNKLGCYSGKKIQRHPLEEKHQAGKQVKKENTIPAFWKEVGS